MVTKGSAAIVPVAIKNTDRMMGKKTGVAYPGTIEIVLLQPIGFHDTGSENLVPELLLKTREAIAKELAKETSR